MLILIDDLKTGGAGRVALGAVPQVLKNLDFLLYVSADLQMQALII